MKREEFIAKMNWLETAASRAKLRLPEMDSLPDTANELVYWKSHLERLDKLVDLTHKPHVGLILGKEVRYVELGTHGTVFISGADTIDHLLRLIAKMSQVRFSVTDFEYKRFKRYGRFYVRPVESLPCCHVEIDLSFAGLVQLLETYLGNGWRPVRVSYRHSRPIDTEPYTSLFGTEVRFDQADNYIDIGVRYLDWLINDTETAVYQAMRQYANQLILRDAEKRNEVSAQCRLYFLNNLGKFQITQETLAKHLNISRATLQRRLETEATSYRGLRLEVIGHMAREYLSRSETPISTIADRLGFSSAASFSRTFASIEGVAPTIYRKMQR